MFSRRRIKEWLTVVKASKPSLGGWFRMAYGLVVLFFSRVSPSTWRRRMNKCYSCPVFDPVWKRCRPYGESSLGCGCYVPYSNMIGKECWGRETQGPPFGWGEEDGH